MNHKNMNSLWWSIFHLNYFLKKGIGRLLSCPRFHGTRSPGSGGCRAHIRPNIKPGEGQGQWKIKKGCPMPFLLEKAIKGKKGLNLVFSFRKGEKMRLYIEDTYLYKYLTLVLNLLLMYWVNIVTFLIYKLTYPS